MERKKRDTRGVKGRGRGKGKDKDSRFGRGRGRPRMGILRKRKCRFCGDKNLKIDYMDYQFLRKFTTERGKITPSRFSGNCAKHQRKVTKAIKRARNIGLLPYVAE